MFGVAVTQLDDGSFLVDFLKSKNVDMAVSEIDDNYQFQDIELSDIEFHVSLHNDLRNTIKYEVDGSFVDDNPVDSPHIFELPRRGRIEIVPSNVRSQSFVITGKSRFARLIIN